MIEEKTEFNLTFKRVKKRSEPKEFNLLKKVKNVWNTIRNFL